MEDMTLQKRHKELWNDLNYDSSISLRNFKHKTLPRNTKDMDNLMYVKESLSKKYDSSHHSLLWMDFLGNLLGFTYGRTRKQALSCLEGRVVALQEDVDLEKMYWNIPFEIRAEMNSVEGFDFNDAISYEGLEIIFDELLLTMSAK